MKNLKKILILFVLFLFVFSLTYFFIGVFGDEIWNYGFSYNISLGLVPYRDFNMIVTPLYSFILGIILFLFGHHLYLMYIFNSFFIVLFFYLMYKRIGLNSIFVSMFFLIIYMNGYNLLCVCFAILLLLLFNKKFKYKNFIFGIIIGLLILTKQTVGFFVMLPLLFFSKNKIKFLIGMFLPLLIFSIYLIYNGALYSFIDYCFLGMLDFTGNNKLFAFAPMEIAIIILLIYFYKRKFVGEDVWIVLMFQIIVAPIFDIYHFLLGFIVFYYYLFSNFKINIYLKVLFTWFFIIVFFSIVSFPHIYSNSKSYLYGKCLLNNYNFDSINTYYQGVVDDYDNTFLFSDYSYMVKLNNNKMINKFDLINDGNMGYNGYKKYIREINDICDSGSCFFVVDKYYVDISEGDVKLPVTNQTNLNIIKYVYNNYNLIDSDGSFNFYSNK